ncbi:MAG: phosphatase PAP2 family protein [Chitinophagales bacterium]
MLRNKLTWIPLYALLAFLLYRKYGLKVFYIGLGVGVVVLLSDQISSSLIKPWIHRLRPCNNPEIQARLLLEYCGGGYSFVSSHAANHFGMAVFFAAFFERKFLAAALLLLWAFVVSFSQVYVGVHFPVDVIAGGLLGAVIGLAVSLVVLRFVKRT